jgi:hypothetical protein
MGFITGVGGLNRYHEENTKLVGELGLASLSLKQQK